MRVRRGEGEKGRGRDREGQEERKEAFQRWQAEREIEWARKDSLARLDGMALQVLDRMLRTDEERRVEASSDDGREVIDRSRRRTSARFHPVASSSSPGGDLHATPPPPSSPPATSIPDDDDNEDDANVNLSNLSPISRRRIYKRLHMRRVRAEAKGAIAQLDLARLKPGRKVSATSKYRQPKPRGDGHAANDGENPNLKQPARGDTRPYKMQHEFERLGIGADYLRTNGLGLFHLGALGRLMRCVTFAARSSWLLKLMVHLLCFSPGIAQVVSSPGLIATRGRSRIHSNGNDPEFAHARRAVHAGPCATNDHAARTGLCSARTHKGLGSWRPGRAPDSCASGIGAFWRRAVEHAYAL